MSTAKLVYTVEPVVTASGAIRPEFIRLPAPGTRCPHTGLARSTLNELTIPNASNDFRPPVRSVVLRKRGAMRGIRLINYDSLLAYLETLSCEPGRQAPKPAPSPDGPTSPGTDSETHSGT